MNLGNININPKHFLSRWFADETIYSGRVDLIPCDFSQIPNLIKLGEITIDIAFIQITSPNKSGYCCLGVSVDITRDSMDQANLVVEEINKNMPHTYGDAFIHISNFDYLVQSEDPPTHSEIQKYVNIDYREIMSVVGLAGRPDQGRIIAEARFIKEKNKKFAEIAFVVDENYQNIGIATYMYNMLIKISKEMKLEGFVSYVLRTNAAMMRIFKKV